MNVWGHYPLLFFRREIGSRDRISRALFLDNTPLSQKKLAREVENEKMFNVYQKINSILVQRILLIGRGKPDFMLDASLNRDLQLLLLYLHAVLQSHF